MDSHLVENLTLTLSLVSLFISISNIVDNNLQTSDGVRMNYNYQSISQ